MSGIFVLKIAPVQGGENLKVEATTRFRNLKVEVIREIGDRFEVAKIRYKGLAKKGLVKPVTEEPAETAAKIIAFF